VGGEKAAERKSSRPALQQAVAIGYGAERQGKRKAARIARRLC